MSSDNNYTFEKERDLSILIVDNEDIVVKTIAKILQVSNPHYFIKTAKNVEEALVLVEKTYWDTILLDLSLPMYGNDRPDPNNGLYFLDKLNKELKILPPIIAMTGHLDDELSDTVLDKGAYYFLNKPLKPKSLSAIVNNATKFQQAGFDGLTGLLNRKIFEERLKIEFERVKRKNLEIESMSNESDSTIAKSYLSLLFFDGDNFKKINDTYTHLVGDQVLKKISSLFIDESLYKCLQKDEQNFNNIIRPYDIASRFGGDEFSIFLPETNHENSAIIAKRISEMLNNFDISEIIGTDEVQPDVRGISLSIGIATYPHPNYVDNYIDLIKLADAAMYLSKDKRKGEIFGYNSNDKTIRLDNGK